MNLNRLTIIVGSFVIVVIILLGWSFAISPKLDEANATAAEQSTYESQNAALEAELVILRDTFSNLEILRAEYGALQNEIPAATRGEDFIDQLKSAADGAGVVITDITVGEPENYVPLGTNASSNSAPATAPPDATTSPATEAPEATAPTEAEAQGAPEATAGPSLVGKLFTVALSVTVEGTSEAVFNFIGAMQVGTRLFVANEAGYSVDGAEPSGTVAGFLLVVKDPQPVVAATPVG